MRRIQVVGTSGSGKSTTGARLAERLGIPFVELDALHWLPGWKERPLEDFRAAVQQAVSAESWVVDGNYRGKVGDLVRARVDTVVWLDLPRTTVMRQVTTRTLARWWRGEVLWGTNRESLRMALSPDSILWWAWSTHARRRASYERELAQVPYQVVRLRTRKEVDRWLERI
jgi:adenylate kinase family enzyme